MKNLSTLLLFILIATLGRSQTIKISEMPTYIGNPKGSYVPIVVNGANRKIDADLLGFGKVDSVFVAGDSLKVKKSNRVYAYKLSTSTGGTDSNAVKDIVQKKFDSTKRWAKSGIGSRVRLDNDTLVFETSTNSINASWFGAVADANYEYNGMMYKDAGHTQLATDNTPAFRAAVDAVALTNGLLHIDAGPYWFSDSVRFHAPAYINSSTIEGAGMLSTTFFFSNTTPGKSFFSFDYGCVNMKFSGFNIQQIGTPRTAQAFYFYYSLTDAAGRPPLWKFEIHDVQWAFFYAGLNFDGPLSNADAAYLSEFRISHSKFKNNRFDLINNNIQSVNLTLEEVDMENDDPLDLTQQWTHILWKKGTVWHHIGGSVIGAGPYFKYQTTGGGDFQPSSKFTSTNIKVEHRGDASHIPAPLFHHDETKSNIIFSHFMDIVVDKMSVVSGTYPGNDSNRIFASLGGKTKLEVKNFYAAPDTYIRAWVSHDFQVQNPTGFINATDNVYGLHKLTYLHRGFDSYLGADTTTVLNTNTTSTIPSIIQTKTTQEPFHQDNTADSVFTINGWYEQDLNSGFTQAQTHNLTLKPYNRTGISNSTYTFMIPQGRTLVKMKINKPPAVKNVPFVFTLSYIIGGVAYQVAKINSSDGYGYMESYISIPLAAALQFNSPNGTTWDGKAKLQLTGAGEGVNAYNDLIMIEYY